MTKLICLAGAAVMALSIPAAAEAQNGNGNGNGNGKGRSEQGRGGDDRGGGRGDDDRGRGGENRGRGQDDRGGDRQDRGRGREITVVRSSDDGPPPARIRVRDGVVVAMDDDRGQGRGRGEGRDDRDDRRVMVDLDDDGPRVFRGGRDRVFIDGCPPGLARKNNGCLPPGQARQVARASADPRYDWVWGQRGDDWSYRYDDGYLYRVNSAGSPLGWLPALGGALSLGNVWPTQYQYQPVPQYFTNYYGLNQPYDYRYADGALYGLDPRTQAISQVAALLTGQQWNVGQQMPSGYDVYNVPYAYRSQYVDSADSWYRYNDGYVYQVDPTTRLVQSVIQLLT